MSEDKLGEVIETVKDAVELAEEVKEAVEAAPAAPVNVSEDIKEIQEVIKALDVLASHLAKVFADGKVDGSDFVHVVSLLQNANVFIDAAKDIKDVSKEIKDLDEQELIQLGMAGYALVKKVVAAVKLAKA